MQDLHERAKHGIRLLLGRQVLLQLTMLAGGIVAARRLAPAEFGAFGIAFFIVATFGLVSDAGMRGALIQRAGALSPPVQCTAFLLTQGLSLAVMTILFVVAPSVAALYPDVPADLAWLVRLLSVELYLASWRVQSEVLLERELRYESLAVIEVLGALLNNGVLVTLALGGHGAASFVWGVLASSALRTLLLARSAPWRIVPAFDRDEARALLATGVPLQLNRALAVLQVSITPTLVAGLVGPAAVGLLQWAGGIGLKPLELVENVVRVSLSHFSRLQDRPAEVTRVLSRYVVAFAALCGLWFTVLAVAGHDLVSLVYGARWSAAVPALVVYAALAIVGSARRITATALIGLGRARLGARVTALTSALAVATSVVLVLAIGPIGVPIGQLVGTAICVPLLLRGLHPGATAAILGPVVVVLVPIVAAVAAGTWVASLPMPVLSRTLLVPALAATGYVAAGWWVAPAWLIATVRGEVLRFTRSTAT